MPKMESFELIDNFFQIVVLLCAAAAAGIFALRRRSRDLLILSLAYDNKLFNRVEKALLNETPYKNTDLGNNNRVYTLKNKLYLPAIKASEKDTIYIGSNDQIRLKSIQADYCYAAWSRTAFDNQNVSVYSVSIDNSIYTGSYLVHNFYTNQFGTEQVVWGEKAAMLPATNLDLDKVLFVSMVSLQEELSNGSDAGEVRTDFVNETNIHYPMTLRLDAEQHGKNLGELYVNRDKGEIYAKNSSGGLGQPRVWLVVQSSYVDDNTELASSRYWCKDISNDPSLTDEYGFVHVKLDDIRFGSGSIKLSSLDNCKIWMEASCDNAANSELSAVYTYAVEPKPLPEVTVTTITKFFDLKSGEELTSTGRSAKTPAAARSQPAAITSSTARIATACLRTTARPASDIGNMTTISQLSGTPAGPTTGSSA